jgi:hypothetical protein
LPVAVALLASCFCSISHAGKNVKAGCGRGCVGAVADAWARLRVRGHGCGCVSAVSGAWARLRVRVCGCVGAVVGAWARLLVRGRGCGFAGAISPSC